MSVLPAHTSNEGRADRSRWTFFNLLSEKPEQLLCPANTQAKYCRQLRKWCHETYISAQHGTEKTNTRVSRSYEDQRWKKSFEPPESQGPQEARRLGHLIDCLPNKRPLGTDAPPFKQTELQAPDPLLYQKRPIAPAIGVSCSDAQRETNFHPLFSGFQPTQSGRSTAAWNDRQQESGQSRQAE